MLGGVHLGSVMNVSWGTIMTLLWGPIANLLRVGRGPFMNIVLRGTLAGPIVRHLLWGTIAYHVVL